jgi:hypothetical protein
MSTTNLTTNLTSNTSLLSDKNIESDLSNFFNIQFYDERHGEPSLSDNKMRCQFINKYSENFSIVKQILDNIKTSHISQQNMEKLSIIVNNISCDDNHNDLINDLFSIIFCLNEKIKK